MRPPYGQADDRVKAVLKSMGYHNLMWNMDTLDWDIVNKKQDPILILDSFKKALTQGTVINPKKDPGFVSLQHDLYIDTIKKTPQIDELLKQNGFTLVLAHECAGLKSGYQELDNVDAQNHPENSASSTSTLPVLGLLLLPLLVTNI
ncbi:chitin deacetylase [Basidiobolus ranarum]|uniref:Chitin deacetylase n=1 Tax=Basidiobolus ranarum TaxID=34480 RepID=A0ABR2WJR3_9FUNG